MSHSISGEFPESSSLHTSLVHPTDDAQEVINAEMIEDQLDTQAHPPSDHFGSLVYQSPSAERETLGANSSEARFAIATYSLSENQSLEDSEGSLPSILKHYLENLLTPWGMSSILLLLLGNILLSWAQLSHSRSLTTVQNPPETATLPVEQASTLIPEKPQSLSLDALSSLPPSSLTIAKAPLLPQSKPSQAGKLPNTVSIASPNSSLTTALLPPSLRPQLVQYPVNRATIPVKIPPVRLAPVSVPKTVTQSVPVPPAIKPITELPPSPPPENPEKAKATQDLIRQQMVDQMQRQETTPSLGFNQETRLKMQAIQNQTDLNQATEQLQQLQQQYPGNRGESGVRSQESGGNNYEL